MVDRDRFRERWERAPILLDAGMGTRLIERGLDPRSDDSALWTRSHPEVIVDLHRRDLEAGADAILTNTFTSHPSWLTRFGRGQEFEALNREAVALARTAAGPSRFVIGSLGPRTSREASQDETLASFVEQAAVLDDAGVDALLLETQGDLRTMSRAVARIRSVTTRPILVSFVHWPDLSDEASWSLVPKLGEAGVDVIGVNCVCDLALVLAVLSRLHHLVSLPLLVKPSALGPGQPVGHTPAVFASKVAEWLSNGVRVLGGCCGTTEAHLAALKQALNEHRGRVAP